MELFNYLATCKTAKCENGNIPIEVTTIENGLILCGVCGKKITDITLQES
jgi:hypothetical protein